jgi:hypothetical protein
MHCIQPAAPWAAKWSSQSWSAARAVPDPGSLTARLLASTPRPARLRGSLTIRGVRADTDRVRQVLCPVLVSRDDEVVQLTAALAAALAGLLPPERVLLAGQALAGSPTILAHGADPFSYPGQQPSLSCRVYPDEHGHLGPAPTTAQLREALSAAAP